MTVDATIGVLFRELVSGPTSRDSYMLNQGDAGLLRSLDKLSAAEASAHPSDHTTVAAHVDHVRYYLERMNAWAAGVELGPADWGASWHRPRVSEEEWSALRAALAAEVAAWQRVLARPAVPDEEQMRSLASSVAHVAYHVGAIRQLAAAARGPREVS
jgi:hypothetical protein